VESGVRLQDPNMARPMTTTCTIKKGYFEIGQSVTLLGLPTNGARKEIVGHSASIFSAISSGHPRGTGIKIVCKGN
jgi:hypothetical protein